MLSQVRPTFNRPGMLSERVLGATRTIAIVPRKSASQLESD
jgi:hypothetical protein